MSKTGIVLKQRLVYLGADSRKHQLCRGKMNLESLGNSFEQISALILRARELANLFTHSHLSGGDLLPRMLTS